MKPEESIYEAYHDFSPLDRLDGDFKSVAKTRLFDLREFLLRTLIKRCAVEKEQIQQRMHFWNYKGRRFLRLDGKFTWEEIATIIEDKKVSIRFEPIYIEIIKKQGGSK